MVSDFYPHFLQVSLVVLGYQKALLLLLLLYELIYGDELGVCLSAIPSEDKNASACECKFDVSVFSIFEDDQTLVCYNF